MENTTSTGTPVDGLTAPVAPRSQAVVDDTADQSSVEVIPPEQKRSGRLVLVVLIALAVLYMLPALVLMNLFPRIDGQLGGLRSAGTVLFLAGGVFWLLLGIVGVLRIRSLKYRPRTALMASIRLGALVVPMLGISILAPILINVPPSLQLQILSPTSAEELLAPVSVTFGMESSLLYFSTLGLTPLRYDWDYNNDGTVDQETFDPVSTYLISKAGIYNVVAKVVMTDGSVKRVLRRFVVPRASFGVQPIKPIIDESTSFSLEHLFPKIADPKVTTVTKALWDFDSDGAVDFESTGLTARNTFRKLGPQDVSVMLVLSNQTQQTLKRTVIVSELPPQPFPVTLETEPTTLIGPPPFGVFYTLKTEESIASASWDFGDQKTAEGLRVAHQYAAVGSYTVTASVRSKSGAIAKLSKLVRVTQPLDIRDLSFEGSPAVSNFSVEGAVPLTIDLTPVTLQSLINFSWDAPTASESLVSGKTLHAVYRDEGKYFIDLLGIDPEEKVFRKRITVTALPPASSVSFSMSPTTPTAPALVTFDASDTFIPSGEEVTGFEWNFGDQGSGGGKKFSGARTEHKYEKPGTYVIELIVRTVKGNSYSGKKTLVVRAPLIDACVLASRSSGTVPLGVRFDTSCSTGDFVSWKWNFGDGSESDQQSPTHVFLNTGEFRVTLIAVTRSGQSATTFTLITVSQ